MITIIKGIIPEVRSSRTVSVNRKSRNQSPAREAYESTKFRDASKLRRAAEILLEHYEQIEHTGLDVETLENLVCTEELLAIESLGTKYIAQLRQVGITTIAQLSTCDPFELHEQLAHHSRTQSMGRVPNRITIEYWIEQAQIYVSK